MSRIKDITGQRFGRLIALEATDQRTRKGSVVWKCLCDCGATARVPSDALVWGRSMSCGCLHKEASAASGRKSAKDLRGRKFGRLTAVSPTQKRASGSIVWKCSCDCGGVAEVRAGHLRAGATKSCGCLKRETKRAQWRNKRSLPEEAYKTPGNERQSKYLLRGYVVGAILQTTDIQAKDITPEMVEAKREQLKMHRELRRLRHGITGKGNTGTESVE